MSDGGRLERINTLLDTPLSVTQRGVIAEISSALDGWKQSRAEAANGHGLRVEAPELRVAEFDCGQVIESALAEVRKRAGQAGTQVQTEFAGSVPERGQGDAQHIHHLVTLLAISLPQVAGTKSLDLHAAYGTQPDGKSQLLLTYLVPSNDSAETLSHRLNKHTGTTAAKWTVPSDSAELTFAAAWQLAVALGGNPTVAQTDSSTVRVQISLPLTGHSIRLAESKA